MLAANGSCVAQDWQVAQVIFVLTVGAHDAF